MARREEDTGLVALWREAWDGQDDALRRLVEHLVQRVLEEEMNDAQYPFSHGVPGSMNSVRTPSPASHFGNHPAPSVVSPCSKSRERLRLDFCLARW